MLDQSTRTTVLRLRDEGHGVRAIADALGISRGAVKRVLRAGTADVPHISRSMLADPHREEILALYKSCKGNLVRVHEELLIQGAKLSYQAVTAFCRRHGIGREPVKPAGQYVFAPGVEMQHDTSPHVANIGGREVPMQTASLVLGYSRMLFIQCYPRFSRFECKVFLTDALQWFGGSCVRCMIDNTHVVVLSGTGPEMVPVPEMAAFGDRFAFDFVAHEVGDANRSAKVERRFHFIENNFLAGRKFTDFQHLNVEAHAWCDRVNATYRRTLRASARELFAIESVALRPLPVHVPEVYLLHHRIVDSEGYINVHRTRYSAPWRLIGRQLEVRESKVRVEMFLGPRLVATHARPMEPADARVTDPAHRPPRGEGLFARKAVAPEEKRLGERAPEVVGYLDLLRRRGRGSLREIRMLLRMVDEYPRDALLAAINEATRYGLTDLDRLERMVLRGIAREFFVLPDVHDDPTAETTDDHATDGDTDNDDEEDHE